MNAHDIKLGVRFLHLVAMSLASYDLASLVLEKVPRQALGKGHVEIDGELLASIGCESASLFDYSGD